MSRGVLAIFGPTKWSTLNMLTSFTDFYNIPYISWSFLGEKMIEPNEEISQEKPPQTSENNDKPVEKNDPNVSKSKENTSDGDDDEDYDSNNVSDGKILTEINDFTHLNSKSRLVSQIYLKPDIVPTIIEMIKFYDWYTVYYVYNYDHAIVNLEAVFEYQNSHPKFLEKLLIRKIIDTNNFRDMLRLV
jgi:hypothetical protein